MSGAKILAGLCLYGPAGNYMNKPKGISVLAVVLVVGMVSLSIALSLMLTGATEIKKLYLDTQSDTAFYTADSCVGEAIYKITQNVKYQGEDIKFINGSFCRIVVTEKNKEIKIVVAGTYKGFISKIEIDGNLFKNESSQAVGFKIKQWKRIP